MKEISKYQLGEMRPGQKGYVLQVKGPQSLVRRLMEFGIVEQALVEVVHQAPFGKDPIVIRVRGGLLALRRKEAQGVALQEEGYLG